MNNKAKLLFDECVGHPLVTQLMGVIGIDQQEVELSHVLWRGFGGMNDDIWIPQIAEERWIIITGDQGRRPKPGTGEKLPIVCANFGVTYVSFSTAVNKLDAFLKYRTILTHWDRLISLKDEPRGSGFQIRSTQAGHTAIVLKRPPLPEFVEQQPKQQKTFLGDGESGAGTPSPTSPETPPAG